MGVNLRGKRSEVRNLHRERNLSLGGAQMLKLMTRALTMDTCRARQPFPSESSQFP